MKKLLLGVYISLFIITCSIYANDSPQPYFPTEQWRTATPEEQGMNSTHLLKMLKRIDSQKLKIDSLTIIRNGYMVLDYYAYPFTKSDKHSIFSCSKSITSAIFGIALHEGYIKNVDNKVVDYFPDVNIKEDPDAKSKITLKHLLTMTHGIDTRDSYEDNYFNLEQIATHPNWADFILNCPMEYNPGEVFYYSNFSTYLLSAVISRTTGKSALEYGNEKLFKYIGIKNVEWDACTQGVSLGYAGLHLTAHDMARFGYLFLRNGKWEDKQLIPHSWIIESTKRHIDDPGYGYQWWPKTGDEYIALGYGEQIIAIFPNYDMVVVFTASEVYKNHNQIMKLLYDYIVSSIISNHALPENTAYKKIAPLINAKSKPDPPSKIIIPQRARQISGKKYLFDNCTFLNSIIFNFDTNNEHATIETTDKTDNILLTVGLNNQFRKNQINYTDGRYSEAFVKGRWVTNNTFLIEYRAMRPIADITLAFKFKKDGIQAILNHKTLNYRETATGMEEN